MKKELADSLRMDCYRRKSKDLICRTFHKEMQTVYQALRKQDLTEWKERNQWYWEKFFLLIRTKFDIEIIASEDSYYFLAKRVKSKAVKKADLPVLKLLSKVAAL